MDNYTQGRAYSAPEASANHLRAEVARLAVASASADLDTFTAHRAEWTCPRCAHMFTALISRDCPTGCNTRTVQLTVAQAQCDPGRVLPCPDPEEWLLATLPLLRAALDHYLHSFPAYDPPVEPSALASAYTQAADILDAVELPSAHARLQLELADELSAAIIIADTLDPDPSSASKDPA